MIKIQKKDVTYENFCIRKTDEGYTVALACPNCKRGIITLNSTKSDRNPFPQGGIHIDGHRIVHTLRCDSCGTDVELTEKQAKLLDLPMLKFEALYNRLEEEQRDKTWRKSISPDMVHPP